MRHLHYLEIENFKRFGGRQRIELDHPAVLIGPNNCGKTSAIQAIALWSMGLRTWWSGSENSKAEKKSGKPLNRLNILQVPVPRTRDFWHDLKVTNKVLRITLGVSHGGTVVPLTMVFRHHASDELVYCEPAPEALEQREALEAAAGLEVSILYPMSGIAAEEAVILPNRVDYHLGRGSTAEVVRNLCLLVAKRSGGDWERIVQVMRRLFQVDLGQPAENERGAVDLSYSQSGTKGSLDLSLAGRGFQQMLLIFAHLFAHKRSVLLIDEPDAHLEILRQRQVYILLREIAAEVGSQVILVTHSEVILDAALDRNLTLLLDAKADSLAAKPDIRDTLKHYGAAHYVKARERGYVLYVEGSNDIDMLAALAARLGHAASKIWDERLNVYYVQDNYPARSVESELERVEGGFGITPREHFFALRGLIPTLKGLALLDNNDGHNRTGSSEGGLEVAYWKRYEAENYFITPDLLVDHARAEFADLELFGSMEGEIRSVMGDLVLERVFEGDRHSFETYRDAAPDAAALIWQTKSERLKMSSFAEEFFRRVAERTGTTMLLRKGELHRLIAGVDPKSIPPEVTTMLDRLAALFHEAQPGSTEA